eukprot:480302_1
MERPVSTEMRIMHFGTEESSEISAIEDDRKYQADNSKFSDENDTNYKLLLLVWLSRAIPILAVITAFGCVLYLTANRNNWSTDRNSPEEEILRREANRGLFVSILSAVLLNFVGAFMFYIKVNESLVITNYGFILSPVIGF